MPSILALPAVLAVRPADVVPLASMMLGLGYLMTGSVLWLVMG
jgi:hypothetical protein